MAESREHVDPKEATEAKLCAYLEGELAAGERQEIEKYLQSNPQHQQLLKELATIRERIASLPREKAPPEIAEDFEGQLERSMLFDEAAGGPIVRINRWPQRIFIAAMVLLAAGLGVIVYMTLPGSNQAAKKYSALPAPGQNGPASSPSISQTIAPAAPILSKQLAQNTASTPQAQSQQTIATDALKNEHSSVGALARQSENNLNSGIAGSANSGLSFQKQPQQMIERAQTLAAANGLSREKTVYVLVSTDNPDEAEGQIQRFFSANNTQLQLNDQQNRVAGGASATGNAQQLAAATQGTAPPIAEATVSNNSSAGSAKSSPLPSPLASGQPAEVTGPVVVDADKTHGRTVAYYARNISRQDAEQLNSALSARGVGQTAGIYFPQSDKSAGFAGGASLNEKLTDRPTSAPTEDVAGRLGVDLPSTAPANAAHSATIQKDQTLSITVDQLVGPGVDKTNTVRVGAEGTITLPMIEPVQAAGQTPAELEKAIAAKYREANLIPDATVRIASGLPATTQSSDVTESIPREADQAAALPTTEPTTNPIAATQPSDSQAKVDVVVVVQATGAPTTQPTTQPAEAPRQ